MIERRSLSQVFGVLGGVFDLDAARRSLLTRDGDDTPWFVQALIIGAAWAAAILTAGFLSVLNIVTEHNAAIVAIPTAIAAILLRRMALKRPTGRITTDLMEQIALALSGLARWFVIIGVEELTRGSGLFARFDHPAAALVVLLALELVFLAFYPDRLQRFLATALAGLWLTLLDMELDFGPLIRNAYVIAAAAGASALWLRPVPARFAAWRAPVGFGLVLFAGLSLFEGTLIEAGIGELSRLHWPATLGMALVSLWITWDVIRERGVPPTSPLALVAYGSVAVLAAVGWREPGLVAAVGLLVLAVHRRERLLFGLGVVFLVAFGVHYYYSLELDLMAKASVLMGSGIVFLAARWGLLRAFDAHVGGDAVTPGDEPLTGGER